MASGSRRGEARLTRRIAAAIRDGIASGERGAGSPLPSTRALAAEWGASRTTVTAAYEQLVAEGFVESRQGARTRVARRLDAALPAPKPAPAGAPAAPPRMSRYARRLADLEPPHGDDAVPPVADFRYGDLAAADFPTLAWKKAVTAALSRRAGRLRYGDPRGSPALREALRDYLWRARGLTCSAEQIVVVNGSQQGLDLCARLLLDPGDPVVVEEPGYRLARQAFAAAGAAVLPVPADGQGLVTRDLPDARLAYVTPSHQFPLGGVLPASRRLDLLAWARRCGAFLVEDDYDGEYRYDVDPVPTLQALDRGERVLYLGTLSKTLSPTLRLGYLVAPPSLTCVFAAAKRLADRHTAGLEQEALSALVAGGAYERHVRRARRRNGERRATLLAALSAAFGDAVEVVGADAGLHVVAWFRHVSSGAERGLVAAARSAGLGIYPVGACYAPGAARPAAAGLIMGYASLDEPAIRRGVAALERVVAAVAGDAP